MIKLGIKIRGGKIQRSVEVEGREGGAAEDRQMSGWLCFGIALLRHRRGR